MARFASRKTLFLVVLTLSPLVESPFFTSVAFADGPASPRPFETITVSVQAVGSAALGSFGDNWDPGAGARADVSTPFYAGRARAGVHVFGHDALRAAAPDFTATYAYLGWTVGWTLPMRFEWAVGGLLGVAYMVFDDDTTPSAREDETELGFGIASDLTLAVTPRWSVALEGEYRKVLTRHPLEYVFAGLGVARTFATPRWLKEFLE